jgi:16S rRNA (adenine1518-N6/adenine1519-N6)-dimethyltransferase
VQGAVIRKRFGQHFLERAWVDKVIRAIDPKPGEVFIEIGPGAGALTRPLAARAKTVTAFEIDRDLVGELRAAAIPKLTIVEGDFLEITTRGRLTTDDRLATNDSVLPTIDSRLSSIRVVGNLPYNVASPILFKLIELYAAGVPLGDATLMLQREVADRLIAGPGSREYGVLSILIGHSASVEMILRLPAGAFRPPPKVLSALVRLRFHAPDPPARDEAAFAGLVQAVFTRRRKTLANALLAFPPAVAATPARMLRDAGIDGVRRPETLSIAEFARLADVLPG